jgi:hypothetical protein
MENLKHAFAFVAATVVAWLALLTVVAPVWIGVTQMGECSYEEVECSAAGELASSDAFGVGVFAVLIIGSFAVGLTYARRRAKRRR